VPCTPRVPSPDVFEHRPVAHAERFGMGRYPKTFTKAAFARHIAWHVEFDSWLWKGHTPPVALNHMPHDTDAFRIKGGLACQTKLKLPFSQTHKPPV